VFVIKVRACPSEAHVYAYLRYHLYAQNTLAYHIIVGLVEKWIYDVSSLFITLDCYITLNKGLSANTLAYYSKVELRIK
jgi:hypothetical protein